MGVRVAVGVGGTVVEVGVLVDGTGVLVDVLVGVCENCKVGVGVNIIVNGEGMISRRNTDKYLVDPIYCHLLSRYWYAIHKHIL